MSTAIDPRSGIEPIRTGDFFSQWPKETQRFWTAPQQEIDPQTKLADAINRLCDLIEKS